MASRENERQPLLNETLWANQCAEILKQEPRILDAIAPLDLSLPDEIDAMAHSNGSFEWNMVRDGRVAETSRDGEPLRALMASIAEKGRIAVNEMN